MIAHTKIQIPQTRAEMLPRPSLMSKLDAGLGAKLTLLSAQAGYGKTTALTEWVRHRKMQTIWASLDPFDNDWSAFWSCVLAAVQKRIPGFGASLGFLLEPQSAGFFESSISAFLNEWQQTEGEWIVVVDDYHFIDNQAVQQSVGYMLEHLPSHVHFYVASRTALPFSTARLMAKGEMNLIDTLDLRLDMEEGFLFFSEMTRLTLTREQMKTLYVQTEGWVSGMQLAAISLNRSGDIAESIRQFSGRQRHISDYLLEEVLEHLPASLREFLLATSLLSRMNHSLCQAVTGQVDCQETLEQLERLNLFIVPLDEERTWYRYHHLLSDYLLRIVRDEEPDRWRDWHTRAAKWLEANGAPEEAVEHYLQAGLADAANRLIAEHLSDFIFSRSAMLLNWIKTMPETSYASMPSIEMFYIAKLIEAGELGQAVRRAEKAEIGFKALQRELPETEWRQVMGTLYYFSGIIAYFMQDFTRTSHYFEQLEYYLPDGCYFQNLGSKRYIGYDQFHDLLSFSNDLTAVESFLLKWIDTWREKKHYPFVGFQYVTYCLLLYEWNRLDEARHYLREAMQREDLQSYVWIWVRLCIVSSLIEQAEGQFSRAHEALTRAKEVAYSPDVHLIDRKLAEEKALLCLRQGELANALEFVESSGLSAADEVSSYRLPGYLVLARVLAASGRTEDASMLLGKLYPLIRGGNLLRDRIRLLILHSVIDWQAGEKSSALERLVSALHQAEPADYIRSFLDEGAPMLEMLTELSLRLEERDSSDSGISSYVNRLLPTLEEPTGDEAGKGRPLTEQETRVLRYMGEGLQNREIASRLYISTETVKFHTKNIYRKLSVHNRMQALHQARGLGILS